MEQVASSREEKVRVAGVNVTLSWPSSSAPPKGVAFILTGAMIAVSEYGGLRDAVLERDHLAVGLYMNVAWPPKGNHRKHARDVKRVFDGLRAMHARLPEAYSVIGHSVGGKVALLLASAVDPERVSAVLSLDPVDINPVEFTHARGPNLPLGDGSAPDSDGSHDCVVVNRPEENISKGEQGKRIQEQGKHIPIVLTCTDGGRGIPRSHNAAAIHALHPGTVCHRHAHAGHMAYCDHGGGWLAKKMMPDVGTKEGNDKAREAARELTRQILGP